VYSWEDSSCRDCSWGKRSSQGSQKKILNSISPQSKSGGQGGTHTSGYEGSQVRKIRKQ